MKTKIISTLAMLFAILIISSCDSWINPGINVDPTSPEVVPLKVILPTTQAGMAFVYGGDIYRQVSLITQHFTGVDRQHLGMFEYQLDESNFDNAWTTMYTGPMMDLYVIMNQAKGTSPHYQGIAEIQMAVSLGMWTDLYGPIPYKEAFKGNDNLLPKYDTQEDIYNSIQQLLTDGVTHLSEASSVFKPAGDDFIYGGDKAKWIKAAHTLKARYYLHIKDYSNALTHLQSGFTSNADDMQFKFGEKESEANPLYQFITQRGDIRVGGLVMTMMNNINDPRRPAYAELDANDEYSADSEIGPFYALINAPVVFISYAEAKFIEAECLLPSNKPGAYTAYIEAITASCKKLGVSDEDLATFLANPEVSVGEGNLTLEHIMNQKYIAMYFNSESWTDWRRTSFPSSLKPIKGDKVPRKMYYPQSERLFNNANLINSGYVQDPDWKFTKVWWDATYW